jgi:hypothetical protein
MMSSRPVDVTVGGACAFRLLPGPRCAAQARSLLASTMTALGLPRELAEDGELAVSELATNVHQHADRAGLAGSIVAPELWVWARTCPALQLVVSVFDADRTAVPQISSAGLLEECGKGLGIVAAVSTSWGSHPSRCRLGNWPVPGKATRFVLPLPQPWPSTDRIIAPSVAGDALVAALAARGIAGSCRSDDKGVSIVQTNALNVWVTRETFSWQEAGGGYVRHPLVDLHEESDLQVGWSQTSHPYARQRL